MYLDGWPCLGGMCVVCLGLGSVSAVGGLWQTCKLCCIGAPGWVQPEEGHSMLVFLHDQSTAASQDGKASAERGHFYGVQADCDVTLTLALSQQCQVCTDVWEHHVTVVPSHVDVLHIASPAAVLPLQPCSRAPLVSWRASVATLENGIVVLGGVCKSERGHGNI